MYKPEKPLNIILLGDPAAGKATQAHQLVKDFHLMDLDMGKELRHLKARNKKFRSALSGTYDKGHLTQTNLVREIFKRKIKSASKRQGILFDGTPKMIGEAKLVLRLLKQEHRRAPIVIYLSVPLSETMKRMSNREVYFKGKYSKRADDNDKALRNRVAYYRKNVSQVVKFFKDNYSYKKVSGLGSRSQVYKRIVEAINQLEKKSAKVN